MKAKSVRNLEAIAEQTRARKIAKALGTLVARLFLFVPIFILVREFEAGANAAKDEVQQ